ncbi:MAG: hypothetical protein F6K11_03255 [Leptolyngbya sp. SIO3F4]|nr:hypothetical protein [Leptolyngbya sp. SIO3F4]
MRQPIVFALFQLVVSTGAIAQDSTSLPTFEETLEAMQMTFQPPDGFVEVEPIPNRQMNYEKAYQLPNERFEVRYALRQHNFAFYKQIFEMTALNISGGRLPEYNGFDPDAVRQEFGADAGATVMVPLGEEFGQDYAYCLLVYLHKTGTGDGYIFYLADDPERIPDWMDPIFHNLRFQE